MLYSTILLDLDGTLMDSGEGIMRCACHALVRMGIEVDDWKKLHYFVGPPLEDSFKDFYGFSEKRTREAVAAYRERYFIVGRLEQKPYAGVIEFLEILKNMGITICLATSKMMSQTIFVIEKFGLSDYIDHVFARDDAGLIHTKADVIRCALTTLHIEDKRRILMVGDRKFDINGAKECGIDAAGVLYGYGDRQELEQAGAKYICKDFNDVISIIKQKNDIS